jgi:hypothetical protein
MTLFFGSLFSEAHHHVRRSFSTPNSYQSCSVLPPALSRPTALSMTRQNSIATTQKIFGLLCLREPALRHKRRIRIRNGIEPATKRMSENETITYEQDIEAIL